MKSVIVLALALCSTAAFARPDTTNLTCRDAAGLVQEQGAVVLSTGNPALYDRFVAGRSFCGTGEKLVTAYVKTLDNNACKIGFACGNYDSEGGSSVRFKHYPSAIGVCKAGTYRTETYEVPGSDRNVNVKLVCNTAGKWVRADGFVAPAPKKFVCKEGATRLETYEEAGSDRNVNVVVQCQAGKWKAIRKY